jgi:hypothetical protein
MSRGLRGARSIGPFYEASVLAASWFTFKLRHYPEMSYVDKAEEVAWKVSSDEEEFYRSLAGLLAAKVREMESDRSNAAKEQS